MELGVPHENHLTGCEACLSGPNDDRHLLTRPQRTRDDGGVVVEIRRSLVVSSEEHHLGSGQHLREAMRAHFGARLDARQGLDFAARGRHPKETTTDTR